MAAAAPDPVAPTIDPLDVDVRYITFRGHDNTDTLLILGHKTGAAVVNGDHTNAKRFDHQWAGRHLRPNPARSDQPGIKWSQSGGRLLITHPDYPPKYLVAPDPAVPGSVWREEDGSQPVNAPALATFSADYRTAG